MLGFPCLTIFLRNFYFGVLSVSLITQCDFWGDPIYPRTCSRVYVYFIEVLLIIFAWIKRKIIPKPQIKIILHFTSVFLSVCWLGFYKVIIIFVCNPRKTLSPKHLQILHWYYHPYWHWRLIYRDESLTSWRKETFLTETLLAI